MLSPAQQQYLRDIETLIAAIWADDVPQGPPVIQVQPGQNLNQVMTDAPVGAIVDLGGHNFPVATATSVIVPKPLTLRNGLIQAQSGVNDMVLIEGDDVLFHDLTVHGSGDTKRGIQINGRGFTAERIEVRNIRRVGQESQAMATWHSPGDIIIRDSVLEGGSQGFLAGGAQPRVANTVPTNLLFENVTFTRPVAWRGQGYVCKTGFELKTGRNVTVRNCTIENVWAEGQTGYGITLTPVNYTNSPDTQIADVLFDALTVRNCGGGMNLLGLSQEAHPVLRTTNVRVENSTFQISRAANGGHGSLMQIGKNPIGVAWQDCTIVQDGEAFCRTADSQPVEGYSFIENHVTTLIANMSNFYGIWTPIGSRGGAWVQQVFPGIDLNVNTFVGSHSIFRAQFPNNTYA